MFCKKQFIGPALILIMMINLAGCAQTKSDAGGQNAAPQSSPLASPSRSTQPKQVTPADLAKLRWIEGTWRGTGGEVPPFYERYKFENDSTLIVETLDETLSKVSDVSRFELKDGHFGSGTADSGSVATALDDTSISFAPLGKGNFFRFQRESENSWKAILNWTDKNGTPKERVYLMERLPDKK
ncbi:MAG TPA: hypothetical protein VMZ30_20225 [Pyrinomonadaceae bacterium]|nr:hypothetical protein [Pyrinomonadaceae bacterium]